MRAKSAWQATSTEVKDLRAEVRLETSGNGGCPVEAVWPLPTDRTLLSWTPVVQSR